MGPEWGIKTAVAGLVVPHLLSASAKRRFTCPSLDSALYTLTIPRLVWPPPSLITSADLSSRSILTFSLFTGNMHHRGVPWVES
ncbi:unnamed protein product [Rhizoctonia solani]|uniref:Uncharacterized protein n=1 Tax=Rhizoctonia solani TaxID=456999 RepID=A0A8H3CVV4_9AGAM|nr:unnamed protein product [Rhizoctonia solani]